MVDDSPQGIDIPNLLRHMVMEKGGIASYMSATSKGKVVKHQDLFDVPCDVWVPAAIGGVIDGAYLLISHTEMLLALQR
jgi:glutamate dehydrogenase/leucine dehydrogenase